MTGEKVSFDKAADRQRDSDARHNDRSMIGFPYLDQDTAVAVAQALYARAGHGDCEIDELAAEMSQTVSGAFRLKTATAKTFGFIEKGDRVSFRLSDLGQQVVIDATELEARATAFLIVPLYRAVYDRYRGKHLPPPKALEREMAALGVAPKQTDKARQIFERSARQAGFFAQGEDRLVQPRFDRGPHIRPVESPLGTKTQLPQVGGGDDGGSGGDISKPLKYQLIDLLDPETMDEKEQQAVWTLINYLARRRRRGEKRDTADEDESPAA